MEMLILSHFDIKAGPKVFLQAPHTIKDKELIRIAQIMDIYEDGFFIHIFGKYKSANLIFDIPSLYVRGRKEILLISLVVDSSSNVNLSLSKELLEGFSRELNETDEAYKAFHINPDKYEEYSNKLIEVKSVFHTFFRNLQPAIKALGAAQIRYQALFKAARDAILILNYDTEIIEDANEQAEKLFQMKIKNLIGSNLKILQFEGGYFNFRKQIFKQIELDNASPIIISVRISEDLIIPLEINANKIYVEGRNLILCIFRNITKRIQAEKYLKESEEKYRLITENLNDIIFVINEKFQFEYINEEVHLKTLGYSNRDLIGEDIREIFHKEDLQTIANSLKKKYKSKKLEGLYNIRVKNINGNYRWLEIRETQFQGPNGNPNALLIGRDITEKLESEIKLRDSEEKYRTLIESSLQGFCILQNVKIAFANKALSRILGYSIEELISMTANEVVNLIYADDRELILKRHKDRLNGMDVPNRYEFRVVRKTGEIRWVEMYATLFEYNGRKAVQEVFIDITEKKEVEKKLRDSEKRYRNIITNIHDIIMEFDIKGTILYISPRVYDIMGFTPEELINRNGYDLIHPDDANLIRESARKVLRAEEPASVEHRILCKNGEYIYIFSKGGIIRENDSIKFLTVVRDINKEKIAEQKLKFSEGKYRRILQNIQEGYYETDIKGNLTEFNDRTAITLGKTREQLLGMNFQNFVKVKDYQKIFKQFSKVYQEDIPHLVYETEIITSDDTIRMIENSVYLRKDPDGKKVGFYGFARDITERRDMEQKLKKSEEEYRLLVENQTDLIAKIGVDGKFRYASPAYCYAFGVKKDDLIGKVFRSPVHKEDTKKVSRLLKSLFKPPHYAKYEHRSLIKNEWKWFSWIDRAILDSEGNIKEILSVGRDITKLKDAEQKLKKSEEKYRLITETANDLIVIFNNRTEFEYLNEEAFYNVLGYTKEELLGYKVLKVLNTKDIRGKLRNFRDNLKNGMEVQLIHKNGHYIWVEAKGRVFINESGQTKILVIARDITERKETEKKLKESEEHLRVITENANDIIGVISEGYQIEYLNSDTFERVSGYSRDEIIGANALQYVHPDDQKRAIKGLILGERNGEGRIELRFLLKNGSYVWFECTGKKVTDSEGKEKGIIVLRNINEKKEAEFKLRKSEEKYRRLIINLSDTIIEVNREGKFSYISPQIYNIGGFKPEDLIGKRAIGFIHPEDLKKFIKVINNAIKDLEPFSVEYRTLHKEGHYIPIQLRGNVYYRDDEFNIVGMVRDLSEKKETEQKLRDSETNYKIAYDQMKFYKDLFAHDISNIIQNMNSSMELYNLYKEDQNKQEKHKELLSVIKDQIIRAKELIKNVNYISQIEDYEISIERTPLLKNMLDALKHIREDYSEKNINIQLNVPNPMNSSDIEVEFYIDANELLIQVFENILSNAVKYNENPEINLNIKFSDLVKDDKDYWKIELNDNGMGISDDKKSLIFQGGFRNQMGLHGMGLGLSLSRKIIESYNGNIFVDDRIKGDYTKGSNFTILIPKAKS